MIDLKGNILWVDDEIDLLKPHIIYLENKGYKVTSAHSGEDALHLTEKNNYDLVLLDEMMTGLDGLTTLKLIKQKKSTLPIIMITKNEEESIMNEAIASQISNYLTKPVNPSQILMACKNILETAKIQSDFATKKYLEEFETISQKISSAKNIKDWYCLNKILSDWMIKFDSIGDQGLGQLLKEQHLEANKIFSSFIQSNYERIIDNQSPITNSSKILIKHVAPYLENNRDVVFILIDCLRFDQWKSLENILLSKFDIETSSYLSLLPTATPFSRNAIFSGLYPDEIPKLFPDEWKEMLIDEKSMNGFEKKFLRDFLDRNNFKSTSMNYTKITSHKDGDKFASRINEYKNTNLLALVINFVDVLGHSRSESNVLKEMIPNESAYRKIICSWLEQSWLKKVFEQISQWDKTVVLTSDHGSIRVKKPVKIKGDKNTSSGIRYKFGKNLNISSKYAMKIDTPENFRIPAIKGAKDFIFAKSEYFFLYPNDYNKYLKRYKNSFQHGGISMDEMIIPIAILNRKK